MHKAAHIGLTILGGGLVLGALLGAYADPEMKSAPEPTWQLSGRPAIEPGPVQHFVSLPEDLSPHIGYRPDLDYAAEIDDWSPRYPSWAYSEEPADDDYRVLEDQLAFAEEPALAEPLAPAADPAAADREPDSPETAPGPSHEGHRIARVQSDGLW